MMKALTYGVLPTLVSVGDIPSYMFMLATIVSNTLLTEFVW